MLSMTEHTITVGISKSHLDVFNLDEKATERFENTLGGLRALRKWLGSMPQRVWYMSQLTLS